ncbi:Guanine nucleotide exchange factor for Cdc42p [Dipsacomyces acuminosporus]|nr:Guanine nucleotide exchange factor for Cdc42p [Dipsacomyces acuminosporus]
MYRIFGVFKSRFDWMPTNIGGFYFGFRPSSKRKNARAAMQIDGTTTDAISAHRNAYMSPYDRAVKLLERLLCLPSISVFLYPILVDENIMNKHAFKEPTKPLRTLFEHGYTLNILLNELESPFVATINLHDRADEDSYTRYQTHLFWAGCVGAGLESPQILGRLHEFDLSSNGEDLEMTIATVARILDILQERGRLCDPDTRYMKLASIYPTLPAAEIGVPRHIELAAELSKTEVAYVQDLERLKSYAEQVRHSLDGTSYDIDTESIFIYVDRILAVHRKFSMGIQYLAGQPVDMQLYGALYEEMYRDFDIYSSFCASRQLSQAAYKLALPILQQISGSIDPVIDLPALLMRPVQRLAQYPIIFQSILDAVCKSCMDIKEHEVHSRSRVIKSIYAAVHRSKRILTKANEATREMENELRYTEFFERLDLPIPSGLAKADFGRLLTSGTVLAKVGSSQPERLEAYLFERNLVLCEATEYHTPPRPSRFHRTLSSLHMSMRNVIQRARDGDRRRSAASSVSTSTSGSRSSSRARTLVSEASIPISRGQSTETVFRPLTINTDRLSTWVSLTHQQVTRHGSLDTLHEQSSIKFATSADTPPPSPISPVTDHSATESVNKRPGLFIREMICNNCISQVSLSNNADLGLSHLSIQSFVDGMERMFVFKHLSEETEGIWIKMLKRAVPVLPLDSGNFGSSDKLYVNPRFSKIVLGGKM